METRLNRGAELMAMMVVSDPHPRVRGGPRRVYVAGPAVAVVAAAAVLLGGIGDAGTAAPILVAGVAGRHNLGELLAWIAGGAVVLGAVVYGATMVVNVPLATPLAVGFGAAIGGGLAGSIRMLALGEGESSADSTETMTVDMDDEEGTMAPDPRPADLFEASPDPLVYYDDSGEGPVVLAVNPAFEATFGIGADAVENAALADALVGDLDASALVAAAADDEAVRRRVSCDTDSGTREFLLRLVPVTAASGVRGYVVYTRISGNGTGEGGD